MSTDPTAPGGSAARRVADGNIGEASGRARRAAHTRSFSAALGWTVLGTVFPGLGLWRSGRRLSGGTVMAVFVLLIGGGLYLNLNRSLAGSLALAPGALHGVAIGMVVLAVLWVAVIGFTHLALRPSRPTVGQRAAGAAVVGALSLVVAAPMAVGAGDVWSAATFVDTVFGTSDTPNSTRPTINAADPWKDKDRINFLILGGDSGNDRAATLGDRTDTIIVASVDTHSGATTLFTLPRNTEKMPFPADSPLHRYYPHGFTKPGAALSERAEYLLNAMYRNVPRVVPPDVLGDTKNLGADVVKVSVGEALGLKLDYYVLVNMDGFKDFINAIGGIRVNVNYRIPIGGQTDQHVEPDGYIEPGPDQHLNGRLALWYARGRYGLDDYKRMERQRCVINAVVEQSTPQAVLTNFQSILAAGQKTIQTDVPRSLLPALLDLGMKVKGTKLRSVTFTPGVAGFQSYNPNWDKVRARVQKALKETEKGVETSASPTPSGTASPSPGGSGSPSPGGSASPTTTASPTGKAKSDDLDAVCGYHPEKP